MSEKDAENKNTQDLRALLAELEAFHKKVLKRRGGKLLPDSTEALRQMGEGR